MTREEKITSKMLEYADLVCRLINEIDELLGVEDEG